MVSKEFKNRNLSPFIYRFLAQATKARYLTFIVAPYDIITYYNSSTCMGYEEHSEYH